MVNLLALLVKKSTDTDAAPAERVDAGGQFASFTSKKKSANTDAAPAGPTWLAAQLGQATARAA